MLPVSSFRRFPTQGCHMNIIDLNHTYVPTCNYNASNITSKKNVFGHAIRILFDRYELVVWKNEIVFNVLFTISLYCFTFKPLLISLIAILQSQGDK